MHLPVLLTTVTNLIGFLNGPWVRWPLTGLYLLVLLMVAVYGLHRYWLVWLYYRHRRQVARAKHRFVQLPRVTVQLPMFNEAQVARRIIDAACRINYPGDRLQIQVLDDSTDESAQIAETHVQHWQSSGVDIQYLHRSDRAGFKAGALQAATGSAKGELIAIFDADFVPDPNFLKRTVHHFCDETVGMVQTRWGHLNRDDGMLTRSQAIFLDGHFLIEHGARNRSGRWINFNGTAGVWRKSAIASAGGWQHDTLTEDIDLSYRAQLAGWKFVFLPRVECPAELPPEINAFKAQQHRWTKGSIQTAIKLLPTLFRAKVPPRVKVEAFFHLTSPMVYLYVTLMVLLFYPAFYVNLTPFKDGSLSAALLAATLLVMGTASASVFYIVSQREQKRSVFKTVLQLPVLMSLGIGIALNNARGCIEALVGHQSPFVRTPKYNTTGNDTLGRRTAVAPTPSIKMWMTILELGMGVYTTKCASLAVNTETGIISVPFLVLFAAGYWYVGLSSLWSHIQAWRGLKVGATAPRLPCSGTIRTR